MSIKTQYLPLVFDSFARTRIVLLQRAFHCDTNVVKFLRQWLIQSSKGCSKEATLNLSLSSLDISQVSAEVEEWVRL